MPYGTILVTLANGRGLPDKDLFGRNDAYGAQPLTLIPVLTYKCPR